MGETQRELFFGDQTPVYLLHKTRLGHNQIIAIELSDSIRAHYTMDYEDLDLKRDREQRSKRKHAAVQRRLKNGSISHNNKPVKVLGSDKDQTRLSKKRFA